MNDRMPGQRFQDQAPANPSNSADDWRTPVTAPPPVAVQRYHSNAPLIAVLAGLLVVALAAVLVWAGLRPQSGPATPTASGTGQSSADPTPSPNWQGIPYETSGGSGTGYWQVSPAQWNGDTVTVTTTVTSDQGTLRFTFFALDNKETNLYQPVDGTLQQGSVSAGQSATGTLTFELPQGDFTLYLATSRGVQITALVVSG